LPAAPRRVRTSFHHARSRGATSSLPRSSGMQPQLEEGEFCPPDYPTVICKATGPRVVWVGQRKSGFTRRCSVTMRRGETALAAATRKLNELKDNASLSDVPDDDSGRQSAEQQPAVTDEQQQPAATDEQQPAATEVVGQQGRPEREVRVPDFLQPCEEIRQFATGSRKRRRDPDDERCTKRACECASVRAERDEYKQRCKEQAAAHLRLREKVSAIAHDVAGGDGSIGTAASAMQQALLELLDLQEGVELSGDESEGEESEDGSSQDEDASDDDDAARSHPRGGHVQSAVRECLGNQRHCLCNARLSLIWAPRHPVWCRTSRWSHGRTTAIRALDLRCTSRVKRRPAHRGCAVEPLSHYVG
jgi:hypothetical protein